MHFLFPQTDATERSAGATSSRKCGFCRGGNGKPFSSCRKQPPPPQLPGEISQHLAPPKPRPLPCGPHSLQKLISRGEQMRANRRRPQIDSESDFLGLYRRPTFSLKIALPVVAAFTRFTASCRGCSRSPDGSAGGGLDTSQLDEVNA